MTVTRRHFMAGASALGLSGRTGAQAGAQARAQAPPVVFAAASLKGPLDEIALRIPMRISYGGSGGLARQILAGAPAALFVSANPEWMQVIRDAARLARPSVPLLGNSLVVISQSGAAPVTLADLPGAGHIAMGFVNAVPAGQYGRAAFETLGIWDAVAAQVVQTENVRAALALVARGEVPFGVVYGTDALAEPKVTVVAHIAPRTHPPITYDLGLISPGAVPIWDSLQTPVAQSVYARHGFTVL